MEPEGSTPHSHEPATYPCPGHIYCNVKMKVDLTSSTYVNGKAIPLQAWTGPDGSRRLRLPDLTLR